MKYFILISLALSMGIIVDTIQPLSTGIIVDTIQPLSTGIIVDIYISWR